MSEPEHDGKPRLLVLASTFPRWVGDPEPGFVYELAKRLVARFDVTVLCPHAPGARVTERMGGVEVVRYRYAPERLETLVNDGGIVTNLKRAKWKLLLVPSFVLAQAWMAWRMARQGKIDVVHAHWLIPQGLIAAMLRELPFVVTSHGADLYALHGGVLNALKRFVIARAAAVTVVSSAMLEKLRDIEVDIGKVSILPMGVDLSGRFFPDAMVKRSAHEILFVGRLVEKKGVRYLLEAMPAVLERVPDAHLTIAGFGPEERGLRSQVVRMGLSSVVSFLGAVPQRELPELYRRAALFVAPFVQANSGDQEGLPVALMEAVACGCPIVVGDVAGIEDLLGELKPEVCVDARSVDMFGARVVEALLHPEVSQARSRRVFESAAEHVDWARIAHSYADLIYANIVPKNS